MALVSELSRTISNTGVSRCLPVQQSGRFQVLAGIFAPGIDDGESGFDLLKKPEGLGPANGPHPLQAMLGKVLLQIFRGATFLRKDADQGEITTPFGCQARFGGDLRTWLVLGPVGICAVKPVVHQAVGNRRGQIHRGFTPQNAPMPFSCTRLARKRPGCLSQATRPSRR